MRSVRSRALAIPAVGEKLIIIAIDKINSEIFDTVRQFITREYPMSIKLICVINTTLGMFGDSV